MVRRVNSAEIPHCLSQSNHLTTSRGNQHPILHLSSPHIHLGVLNVSYEFRSRPGATGPERSDDDTGDVACCEALARRVARTGAWRERAKTSDFAPGEGSKREEEESLRALQVGQDDVHCHSESCLSQGQKSASDNSPVTEWLRTFRTPDLVLPRRTSFFVHALGSGEKFGKGNGKLLWNGSSFR